MAISLYNDSYAARDYSQLLATGDGARAVGVALAGGEGELRRGALLKRGEDMIFRAAAAADIAQGSYVAVLDEDVSVGSDAPMPARAYIAGVFLQGKLLTKDGAALGPEQEAALRTQGILLEAYQKADGTASATVPPAGA